MRYPHDTIDQRDRADREARQYRDALREIQAIAMRSFKTLTELVDAMGEVEAVASQALREN